LIGIQDDLLGAFLDVKVDLDYAFVTKLATEFEVI
jgi:hypothetical protein